MYVCMGVCVGVGCVYMCIYIHFYYLTCMLTSHMKYICLMNDLPEK